MYYNANGQKKFGGMNLKKEVCVFVIVLKLFFSAKNYSIV